MLLKVYINCDGGSRGNPGKSAIGILLRDEQGDIEKYKERIGITTNNVAEYKSLIKGMQLALKYTNKELHAFMDSELVILQMKGDYKVKAKHLLGLFEEAKNLEARFDKVFYNPVSRGHNYQRKADALVNDALDSD